MRVFVTGGSGFIGRALVRRLIERGDDVVALVRAPSRAADLEALGATLAAGDVTDAGVLAPSMDGADAVVHLAGVYRVGIPARERAAMWEANVTGAERALDAAIAAGVPRIVHVSTVNAFGNTHGRVVDETYRRDEREGFVSFYDETKYRAHQAALERIAAGAPVLVAQPGGVYGPGDHSEVGSLVEQAMSGRLKFLTFPETGFNFVYVDDAADGILRVLDHGRVGECYVLGGELTTMGELLGKAAAAAGRTPPSFTMPAWAIRASVPIGPLVGKLMRQPPNLRELVRAAHDVTYWASDAKARRELKYSPRGLEDGLRETVAARPAA